MAYYNPHITALYIPIQPKQPGFFFIAHLPSDSTQPPPSKKKLPQNGDRTSCFLGSSRPSDVFLGGRSKRLPCGVRFFRGVGR